MTTVVARPPEHGIARPLKVLIPLIQSELQQGNNAGHEHYRRAGEMLIEAKDQVGHGAWVLHSADPALSCTLPTPLCLGDFITRTATIASRLWYGSL